MWSVRGLTPILKYLPTPVTVPQYVPRQRSPPVPLYPTSLPRLPPPPSFSGSSRVVDHWSRSGQRRQRTKRSRQVSVDSRRPVSYRSRSVPHAVPRRVCAVLVTPVPSCSSGPTVQLVPVHGVTIIIIMVPSLLASDTMLGIPLVTTVDL